VSVFIVTNINTDLSDEKFIKLYSERVIAFSGYAVCNESLRKLPRNLCNDRDLPYHTGTEHTSYQDTVRLPDALRPHAYLQNAKTGMN